MAGDNNNSTSAGNQQVRTVNTNYITVAGDLMSWSNVTIKISNIAELTTWEVPVALSLVSILSAVLAFLVRMLGVVMILLGVIYVVAVNSVDGFIFVVLGAILIYVGGWIKKPGQKPSLRIVLNSGTVYSIVFKKEEFLLETMRELTKILGTGTRGQEITFNLNKCTIDHSNYGIQAEAGSSVDVYGDMSNTVHIDKGGESL